MLSSSNPAGMKRIYFAYHTKEHYDEFGMGELTICIIWHIGSEE